MFKVNKRFFQFACYAPLFTLCQTIYWWVVQWRSVLQDLWSSPSSPGCYYLQSFGVNIEPKHNSIANIDSEEQNYARVCVLHGHVSLGVSAGNVVTKVR